MTELILAYIGAMFIAFEFIRKFHSFRVLPILIMHLPFRPVLNKIPFMKFVEAKEGKKELDKKEIKKGLDKISLFLILYGVLLLIVLIPITIVFIIFDMLVNLLNGLNQIVTLLYRNMLDKYQPIVVQTIKLVIFSQKRYSQLSEEEVLQKLKQSEIPFLPIVGVILLTISFVMQIT